MVERNAAHSSASSNLHLTLTFSKLSVFLKKIEKLLYFMINVYELELQAPYLVYGVCDLRQVVGVMKICERKYL